MSCNVVNHEHTGHRLTSLKPRLLKCTTLALESMGTSLKTYRQPEVLTLPQPESKHHDKDIKS
jgi:hypothetical protein